MTVIAACLATPCGGSQGVALSPSRLSLSTWRGGTASATATIYNTGNNTTIVWTAQFNNTNLTATPSSGELAPLQNTSITVQLNAPNNDTNGTTLILVNTTTQRNFGGAAQVLPAVGGTVVYSVNGTAPPPTNNGLSTSAVIGIGVIVIIALVVVGVVLWKRR